MERLKSSSLIFISQIKSDGSGVEILSKKHADELKETMLFNRKMYKVYPLSLSSKTFIAIGLNSYIVKKDIRSKKYPTATIITARFKGSLCHLNYVNGEKFKLKLGVINDKIWISKMDESSYCEYGSFHAFLDNWHIVLDK